MAPGNQRQPSFTPPLMPNAAIPHLSSTNCTTVELPVERDASDPFMVLPGMGVCFQDLTVSADTSESDEQEPIADLPTVLNAAKGVVDWNRLRTVKRVQRTPILRSVTGRVQPGTLTLVLGRPGSGKSTLLKALGGKLPMEGSKRLHVDGEVTYNGMPQRELLPTLARLTGYVSQHDTHFPTLTVRETLQYAYEFAGGGSGVANDSASVLKAMTPDQVIDQLGLAHCQHTVIGDATTLRGVSGGELKRVTLGEALLDRHPVLLLDEVSTGLDAAATLDIVQMLKHTFAAKQHRTVVVSLLQPSPEVFELFDNVVVLNAGEMLYFGPCRHVEEYFAALGIRCPTNRAFADFLLDLGTSQQLPYEAEVPTLLPMASDSLSTQQVQQCPRSPHEFAERFRQSATHLQLLDTHSETQSTKEKHEIHQAVVAIQALPIYPQGFWSNTASITRRQLVLVRRNVKFLRARIVMSTVMGLIYGSAFYQAQATNVQLVLGMLYQAALFLLLGQTSQIATFVEARTILAKQYRAQLTRTSSYVIACCVGQLPLALLETVIFGTLIYWLGGLDFESALAGRFLVFEALLFLMLLVSIALFFVVAALSPDRNVGFPLAMAFIVAVNLFAGFLVSREQLPDWLIWGYWIDPLAWTLRALAVNAYHSPALDQCVYDGVNYCQLSDESLNAGEYYLSQFGVPSSSLWVMLAVAFLLASYIGLMTLSCFFFERQSRQDSDGPSTQTGRAPSSTSTGAGGSGDDEYTLAVTPRAGLGAQAEGPMCAITMAMGAVNAPSAMVVPVTLGFEDIQYSVPAPATAVTDCSGDDADEYSKQGSSGTGRIELLKGIDGYALPGTMTALMGSSGAGKTTLMDVLAGRKPRDGVRGRVLLNGREASELAIQRCTGYCEQQDVHSDASTIREAMLFSALLRQEDSIPDYEKRASVERYLDLLDLRDIADQVVRGRSREQLKRLSIGVELAAHKSVLFLDEPTSGLDAQAAALVMRCVRRATDSSQCTVVCTIHQPSAAVFGLFDRLLLLQLGGETAYFGDSSVATLQSYFEALPGVKPLPHGYNPATWILECIGAGVSRSVDASANNRLDFGQHFKSTQQHAELSQALRNQQQTQQLAEMTELVFVGKRAASSWTQMRMLVTRFQLLYWRTPSYSLTRLILAPMLGLVLGVLFSGADYTTYQGLNAGVGAVFISVAFSGVIALNSVLVLAVQDRAAFYRERAAQSYNALWYSLGAALAEIPYVVATSLLFTCIAFPLMGFASGGDASWGTSTFALFWLVMALFTLQQVYLGQFFAYAMPGVELAALASMVLISLFNLVAGFNPAGNAIPKGYRWLHTIAPQRYVMSAMAALLFADCPTGNEDHFGCQTLQDAPVTLEGLTVKQYVETVFEMRHDDIARNIAVSLAFAVGFQLLGLIALRFISHQSK